MKKSSVEYTSPYSPANFLAFVDFPEPGRPRMMINVLLGLSASIIFDRYKISIKLYLFSVPYEYAHFHRNNNYIMESPRL